jgi:hypothetical protein
MHDAVPRLMEAGTMSNEEREHHLFIIRIWRERSPRNHGWRGSADHVTSGRRIVSADLDEITDFVRVRILSEADSETGREIEPS